MGNLSLAQFANLLEHIKHKFAMKGRFVRLKHIYMNQAVERFFSSI